VEPLCKFVEFHTLKPVSDIDNVRFLNYGHLGEQIMCFVDDLTVHLLILDMQANFKSN
jgi:hypothetical protein